MKGILVRMNINSKLHTIKKGVIFYFYSNPNKSILKELVSDFDEISGSKFSNYMFSTNEIKEIAGNWKDFFKKIVDEANFNSSFVLTLTDDTEDQIHSSLINLVLVNKTENGVLSSPNRIYFEFNDKVLWKDIYLFISRACFSLSYHYVSAGYNVSINEFYGNKSSSLGAKELRKNKIMNSYQSTWNNGYFLSQLKDNISTPNIIQVLHESLYSKIGFSSINSAYEQNLIHYELGEDYVILCIPEIDLNEENIIVTIPEFNLIEDDDIIKGKLLSDLKNQYNLLNPLVAQYKRPLMYWSDEEWNGWIKRFES